MKLSIAQLDVKRGEPACNLNSIRELAACASRGGADLLCLPEMATTGFNWEKNRQLLAEADQHHQALADIARNNQIAICGSFLETSTSVMPCNTLFYFDHTGKILAKYRKLHLFSLFHEEQHVEAGREIVVADIKYCQAGFGICYDLRFPELFRKNTDLGAQIQILPAAFPHPRLAHYRTLVQARAIENQCFFIATNQSGWEQHEKSVGSAHYFGHSMVVDPWGEILLELGEEEDLRHIDIDLSHVEKVRAKMSVLKDSRPELY